MPGGSQGGPQRLSGAKEREQRRALERAVTLRLLSG